MGAVLRTVRCLHLRRIRSRFHSIWLPVLRCSKPVSVYGRIWPVTNSITVRNTAPINTVRNGVPFWSTWVVDDLDFDLFRFLFFLNIRQDSFAIPSVQNSCLSRKCADIDAGFDDSPSSSFCSLSIVILNISLLSLSYIYVCYIQGNATFASPTLYWKDLVMWNVAIQNYLAEKLHIL